MTVPASPTAGTPGRAWLVWGVGLAAYVVAVFHRTSLGVAAADASERFGIGASEFSTFAVLQLLVYAAMQIPVGVLLDRFGSRVLLVTGGVVMSAGQLLLALAEEPVGAVLARVLVGAGDAMTFICVIRLVPAWFSQRQVPQVTQLTGLAGQLGQIASTFPLVAVLHGPGWTAAYGGAAAVGLVVAVLVLLLLRDTPSGSAAGTGPVSLTKVRADLRESFLHPGTRLGLWTHFTVQYSGVVFGLLWGYPFMTQGLDLSPGLAGGLLTLLVVGGMAAGPVLGRLTAQFPLRRSNLVLGVVISTVVTWTVLLVWPGYPPLWLVVVLVLVLSANGPTSMVGFDFARSFNPSRRLGSATGIVNVGGFVASLLCILLVGLVLDLRAPDGDYDLADYKLAMSSQYVLWGVGLAAIWRTRTLTRRRMYDEEGTSIDPLASAVRRRLRRGGGR
jgi:sugar phosphate permease